MLFVTVYFGIFSIFVCVLYVLHCAPIVRNNDNMSQARRYRGGGAKCAADERYFLLRGVIAENAASERCKLCYSRPTY